MRLTTTHVRFWQSKQAAPGWVQRTTNLKQPIADATIHACINDHAGIKMKHLDTANMITLIRLAARNRFFDDNMRPRTLRDYLAELGHPNSWSSRNIPRRAANARKWLKRITGE